MSNLEKDPPELLAEPNADAESGVFDHPAIEILASREVPLGGPRAMRVRRTLPQRQRSMIGAWCFLDHYGPEDVSVTGGMRVPPHPHTGLQTVSWLFAGEIEHRDSVGSHAMVRSGELNLMTAGRGISHSEVSTASTTVLHGVQLWTALPDAARHTLPFFEHYVPPVLGIGDAEVRVFIGELAGSASPASAFSPLMGAQVDIPANSTLVLDVDPGFEHGVLVDAGEVHVENEAVDVAELAYLSPGRNTITLRAGAASAGVASADSPGLDTPKASVILIGGAPLDEEIVMWWNFIGRSHDDIVEYRSAWEHDVTDAHTDNGRFGTVRGYEGRPLPAPALPNARLRPRG